MRLSRLAPDLFKPIIISLLNLSPRSTQNKTMKMKKNIYRLIIAATTICLSMLLATHQLFATALPMKFYDRGSLTLFTHFKTIKNMKNTPRSILRPSERFNDNN